MSVKELLKKAKILAASAPSAQKCDIKKNPDCDAVKILQKRYGKTVAEIALEQETIIDSQQAEIEGLEKRILLLRTNCNELFEEINQLQAKLNSQRAENEQLNKDLHKYGQQEEEYQREQQELAEMQRREEKEPE